MTILAGFDLDGRRLAGAIATEGDAAVGVSNVFVTGAVRNEGVATALMDAFAGATAAIVERFPDRPVVGYEAGAALAIALATGFQAVGPLRVWFRDPP